MIYLFDALSPMVPSVFRYDHFLVSHCSVEVPLVDSSDVTDLVTSRHCTAMTPSDVTDPVTSRQSSAEGV